MQVPTSRPVRAWPVWLGEVLGLAVAVSAFYPGHMSFAVAAVEYRLGQALAVVSFLHAPRPGSPPTLAGYQRPPAVSVEPVGPGSGPKVKPDSSLA